MASRELRVSFTGDTKDLDRAFHKTNTGLDKLGKQTSLTARVTSRGFSGMAIAARGLAAGIGGVTLGAGYLVKQFTESNKVAKQTDAVLKSTGGAAGVTAKQVSSLATAISRKTGMDDEAIQSGENLLLTFTNIHDETGRGNQIFTRATRTLADMSAALGQDTKSSAIQLGKALNDPIKGVTALQRVGVSFTTQQKEQIKALVESGHAMDAQKLILRELNKEFGGSAAAQATPFDKLKVSAGNLAETLGGYLAPSLGKAAAFANRFLIQMQDGTGAGGRFVQTMVRLAGEVGTVAHTVAGATGWFGRHKTATTALMSVAAGLTTVFVAYRVAVIASTAATRVAAAASAALNLVMTANPIGLVVVALAGLAAGLVVAYKRSETFRRIVDGAFATVKSAASSAWAVIHPVLQGMVRQLKGLIEFVSGVFTGDWRKAWAGIKDIAAGFASGIGRVIVKGVMAGMGQLGHQIRSKIVDSLKFAVDIGSSPVNIGKAIGNAIAKGVGSGDGIGQLGPIGGGQFGGSLMGARPSLGPFAAIGSRFGLRVSSGRRPGSVTSSGNVSYHSSGEAIDEAGSPSGMLGFFNFMKSRFGGRLAELIYTPGGVGVKDGRPYRYGGQVAADHYDHVHVALDTGAPGVGDGIGQIKGLWTRAGGRKSAAAMAAAIAMAESSGQPGVTHRNADGSIDRGLWQINSVHGALSTTNRLGNARAAVGISHNGRDWSPWTTFASGAYKKFLTAARRGGSSGGGASLGGGMAGVVGGGGFGAGMPGVSGNILSTGFGAGVSQFTPDPDFSVPTELDYLNAASSQAGLTAGTADDLSAATALRDYYQGTYNQALRSGDPRIIGPAAEALKQAMDAVAQLKDSIDGLKLVEEQRAQTTQELLAEQKATRRLVEAQGPQLIAGLAAILSGSVGGKVALGFQTPGFAGTAGGVRY